MKKFLCVVLFISSVLIALAYSAFVYRSTGVEDDLLSVGLVYDGKEISFPVDTDLFSKEGWYLYCSESDGVATLLNDSFKGMSILIFSPNIVREDLKDVQNVNHICFSICDNCVNYPEVAVNGVSFGDKKEDVLEKMGTPVNDEGYMLGDVPYSHYYFSKSLDEWTNVSYEFVLVNDFVIDIKVSVDRLYND